MAVGIPQEYPKKISWFFHLPRPVAARLKFWTKIQRKSPENGHFFAHFFVLAIKFHRMNLFQNRFHRWSTFWPYFPMTPIKVNIMAIIGVSHNTHYGKNGHYGCYGSTNYGCKFDLYGCSWKIDRCWGNFLKVVLCLFWGKISKIQHIRHVLVIKWSHSTPRWRI